MRTTRAALVSLAVAIACNVCQEASGAPATPIGPGAPPAPTASASSTAPKGAAGLQQARVKLHALVSEGKLFQARAAATDLLKQFPADAGLQMDYGNILRRSGQPRLALQQYLKVTQMDPKSVDAYVAISQLQLENLDLESALTSAGKAKQLQPNNLDARLAYVSALLAADRVNDGERELQSMIAAGSANPEVLHLAYEVKLRKGDFEHARRYLETAISLSRQPTTWQIELADLEQRMSHPERARAVLKTILVQNPSDTEARLRYARNLELFGGDFDAAISQYRNLLQYEPDSASALTGIERCRAKKNNVALRIKTGLRSMGDAMGKYFSHLNDPKK